MRVTDTGSGVEFDAPQGKIHLVYKKTDEDRMVTFTMTQEALADLIALANAGFPQPFASQPVATGAAVMQPAAGIAGAETTVTTTTVKR